MANADVAVFWYTSLPAEKFLKLCRVRGVTVSDHIDQWTDATFLDNLQDNVWIVSNALGSHQNAEWLEHTVADALFELLYWGWQYLHAHIHKAVHQVKSLALEIGFMPVSMDMATMLPSLYAKFARAKAAPLLQ